MSPAPAIAAGMAPARALEGRIILVTGAHGGLGSAAAAACARAGATVVLLGRKVPKLNRLHDAIAAAGGEAVQPRSLVQHARDGEHQQVQQRRPPGRVVRSRTRTHALEERLGGRDVDLLLEVDRRLVSAAHDERQHPAERGRVPDEVAIPAPPQHGHNGADAAAPVNPAPDR